MERRFATPIAGTSGLMRLFKALLLAVVTTAIVAVLLSWLAIVARRAGIAVPDGLVLGFVVGIAGGSGAYFLKKLQKHESKSDS